MVVMDSDLQVLAQSDSETSNDPNNENSWQRLRQQILTLLHGDNKQEETISAIGISMDSVNMQVESAILRSVIAEMFHARPVVIEPQAICALIAGAGHSFGVITLCGTDSVSFGLNRRGERIQVGGWGHHNNAGGSYDLARDVLDAVANHFDGIRGPTKLSERIMMHLGLRSSADLMLWLHAPDRRIEDVVALAADAVALEDTDAIVSGLISRTADKLAFQAQTAARRLDLKGQHFPLVMAGRLFNSSELLRTLFTQAVQGVLPGAVAHLLTQDFAVCAGMMALDSIGVALPQIDLNQNDPPRRATEGRNPLTIDIQERPTLDFVRLMNVEDQRVPRLIASELEQIATLIDSGAERFDRGGRLFFIGAGTSGRLAVLDAAECQPTFGTTLQEVEGILAGGEAAMIRSVEGAEDDEVWGRAEVAKRGVNERDTMIGVAASGSTPFIIGAVREARERGSLTGCIVNNADSPIAQLVEHPIVVPTGPEVIMGSTRLKAGTAQKLVLNMISTGIMMRVGKTYGNLMVDMQMSNIKLRKRAEVIVAEATELPLVEAADLLERCAGEMKTAIGSYLLNLSPADARDRLQLYNGNLYRCLQAEMTSNHRDE